MSSRRSRLTVPIDPERPTGWALLECLYCIVRDVRRTAAVVADVARLLTSYSQRSCPSRVFLSHTSELRSQPAERSFVTAAEAAVVRAGHAVTEMAYFAARDTECQEYCVRMVESADVYVGIIGHRYGSPVRGRPELSYTELEFETATAAGLPRLVFLISEDSPSLAPVSQSDEHRVRQEAFRRRLREAGPIVAHVGSPAELELAVLHALIDLKR